VAGAVAPAAIKTLAGLMLTADELLLARFTVMPGVGAPEVNVTL